MRRAVTIALFFAVLSGLPPPGRADESAVSREAQLKAAYLFNFAKFVQWPAEPQSTVLNICFVGAQPVQDALSSQIGAKSVGTRQLVARKLGATDSVQGCDVVLFGEPVDPDSPRARAARQLPILTVSDVKGFARHGGIIGLFTDGNRLRFDINIENANRVGLKISSALLQLASKPGE